jgi:hypothetical protein
MSELISNISVMKNSIDTPFPDMSVVVSLQDQIHDRIKKVIEERNQEIYCVVMKELHAHGIEIGTLERLKEFAKYRLTMICLGEHMREIRLDYSHESKGVLLVRYSDEIKVETNKISIG